MYGGNDGVVEIVFCCHWSFEEWLFGGRVDAVVGGFGAAWLGGDDIGEGGEIHWYLWFKDVDKMSVEAKI